MSLSRLHLVFVSLYSMSFLQYRRYTLIRLLPPLSSQSSPLCTRLDIHVNVFLQYRRYTLQFRSFPLSSPPFPLHFRRQFQLFISSPSSMSPRTPLPSTFNTSRRLLCFYSPFSMSSPMSLRLLRRRMRDRPRHFVSFKFVFSLSRRFGLLLFAIVQHVCRIPVVSAILFCSFAGSQSRRACPLLLFTLSSVSPTS
jgi:hypothetical protein